MTSKQVKEYLESNRVHELYKKYQSSFELIDAMSENLVQGDLLNEFELSQNIDRATGVFSKLQPIVNALESYMHRIEYNTLITEIDKLEKVRMQDKDIAKYVGRNSVCDIKDWHGDFKAYLDGAQQIIVSAQSRIKRLTVESSAKEIDFKGDKSNVPSTREKSWDA